MIQNKALRLISFLNCNSVRVSLQHRWASTSYRWSFHVAVFWCHIYLCTGKDSKLFIGRHSPDRRVHGFCCQMCYRFSTPVSTDWKYRACVNNAHSLVGVPQSMFPLFLKMLIHSPITLSYYVIAQLSKLFLKFASRTTWLKLSFCFLCWGQTRAIIICFLSMVFWAQLHRQNHCRSLPGKATLQMHKHTHSHG